MRLVKLINIFRFFLLCVILYYLLQNTKFGAILAFSLLLLSISIRLIELYILRKGENNHQVHTFLDPIVDKIKARGNVLMTQADKLSAEIRK